MNIISGPSTLSLGRSLETLIYYYQHKTSDECSLDSLKPMGRSILIVSPDGRLTDNDFTRSQKAFDSIKNSNPEISFVFITSSTNNASVIDFARNFRDNDFVLTPPKNVLSLVDHVSSTLSNISGSFVNFYCHQPQVRLDYITPEIESVYQIRKEYVQRARFVTKVSI